MTELKVSNHGDIILYPVKNQKPPKEATKSLVHVLQVSETTGNRHEIISKKEPIYRWTKDNKEFVHCSADYEIRHVGGDSEHGVQPVEAGTREVRHEVEYDPWKNELKRVID